MPPIETLVDGLDQPEGMVYDPRDRRVSANLGRRHLTLLSDLGSRGAPLHSPERWAADA